MSLHEKAIQMLPENAVLMNNDTKTNINYLSVFAYDHYLKFHLVALRQSTGEEEFFYSKFQKYSFRLFSQKKRQQKTEVLTGFSIMTKMCATRKIWPFFKGPKPSIV